MQFTQEDLIELSEIIARAQRPGVKAALQELVRSQHEGKHAGYDQKHVQSIDPNYAAGFTFGSGLAKYALESATMTSAPGKVNGVLELSQLAGALPAASIGHMTGNGDAISPADPVWAGPGGRSSYAARGRAGGQYVPGHGTASGSAMPALKYGMNLHLQNGQPPLPADAEFRVLTTCSWEQTKDSCKVYVPLAGVQTELLRATFEPNEVEVKCVNLQGKNYVYTIKPTYRTINPDGCLVMASKTKKNILITIKKAHSTTPEEKHWRDLVGGKPSAPVKP